MARIRSIKPEFWEDEDIATQHTREVRLFYIALWNQADEQARLRGNTRHLKGRIFPYEDDVTPAVIDAWLDDLQRAGRVVRYRVRAEAYLYLPKLGAHQKLDTRLASRHPAPPDAHKSAQKDAQRGAQKDAQQGAQCASAPYAHDDHDEDAHPDAHHHPAHDAHDAHPEPPAETEETPIDADESGRTGVENTDAHGPVDARACARAPALQVAGGRGQVAGELLAHPDDCAPPADAHPAPARKARETDPPEFVEFWDAYPRRKDKGRARKAWAKAVQKAAPEVITAAARAFAEQRRGQDQKFTPHPATWLNGERWNDEPDPAPPPEQGTTEARVRGWLDLDTGPNPFDDPTPEPRAIQEAHR